MLIHKYRTIRAIKICFWGPSLAGKTFALSTIRVMKKLEDPEAVEGFVSVADQKTGRTIFFDQAVFGIGKRSDSNEPLFKVHVFTTGGEKRYKENRKIVLQGIHGLVLVVDAGFEQWDENIWSLKELKKLKGKEIAEKNIPFTVLVNKGDLPWGTRISHRHVEQLFEAADVLDIFPNLENKVFLASSKNAKKDIEHLLRTTPRNVLLDSEEKFKKEFRPKSFTPLMKSLEVVVKEVIKAKLKKEQRL